MARRWPSGGIELFGSAANCNPLAGYYWDSDAALSSFRRKAISSRAWSRSVFRFDPCGDPSAGTWPARGRPVRQLLEVKRKTSARVELYRL